MTITSSVPNSSSTSTSSSDVFSLSSPTPYIIGGVVILTIAVLMFVCLYTGFGKNSQEISSGLLGNCFLRRNDPLTASLFSKSCQKPIKKIAQEKVWV